MDPALDADLGRPPRDRVVALLEDHVHRVVVRFLGVVLVPREPAEAAADVADVREVDVPAYDVRNVVADILLARDVRRAEQDVEVRALHIEKDLRVFARELPSRQGSRISTFMHGNKW